MPRQVLKVSTSNSLRRRPKRKLRVGADSSFLGQKLSRRVGAWMQARMLILIGLAGLISLIIYLTTSPDVQITTISVKGNKVIQSEELVRLSGLQNQPILLANARRAEKSIETIKAVQSAAVRLEFPNRAAIDVVERPAAYIWKVKDTLFLVSKDGIVLGTTPTANEPVALVDVDGKSVAVGDAVNADALQTASALQGLLPKAMGLTPAYFEYSHSEGVVLPTDFAGRVVFGDSSDLDNKVAMLKSMKQTIQENKLVVKYLDLRFQDRPYFR